MLQWFLRFPEFAEFSESSALFRENPISLLNRGTICDKRQLMGMISEGLQNVLTKLQNTQFLFLLDRKGPRVFKIFPLKIGYVTFYFVTIEMLIFTVPR